MSDLDGLYEDCEDTDGESEEPRSVAEILASIIRRCKMEPKKVNGVFTLMLDRVRGGHQAFADFASNAALFGTKDAFCQ